jgi:GntR family transcriptional regulator/MocR family aminotransferase
VVGIPVDHDGIRVDMLERSGADAVILTPSHQWPTGAVLSAESRRALLRWACQQGALIVEDDYDAEYRYDRAPIGAIQGLAPDQVVYAGSASKTLAPGLRLGWLVVPRHLVEDVAAAKITADRGSPTLNQLAFADFLSRGDFDRHLRRTRLLYRRRRDALLDALRTRVPELRPTGVSAGCHLVTWLPPDLDETSIVDGSARRGLGVYGIAPYRISGDGDQGLLFGYASLSEKTITEGIDILADVIAAHRSR